MTMDQSLWDLLRRVDTPTVCNALEVVEGKRGFDRFTRGTVQCSDPAEGAMVGYARTARIAAIAPPEEPPEVIRPGAWTIIATCPKARARRWP